MLLTDEKLAEIRRITGSGGFWYITKQNLKFDALCHIAHILDDWNNDRSVSYEEFFEQNKWKAKYGSLSPGQAHRATVNCVPAGLLAKTDPYDSTRLTPLYREIKLRCGGDFSKKETYQDLINKRLQEFTLTINDKKMNPLLFLFKILLEMGDATGDYSVKLNEFKIFVSTSDDWNDYVKVVQSILRYRGDSLYRLSVDNNRPNVSDVRIQQFLANHEYLDLQSNTMACVMNI